jgi:hypothetical protein
MRTEGRTNMAVQVVAIRFTKAPKHFLPVVRLLALSLVFLPLDGASF